MLLLAQEMDQLPLEAIWYCAGFDPLGILKPLLQGIGSRASCDWLKFQFNILCAELLLNPVHVAQCVISFLQTTGR